VSRRIEVLAATILLAASCGWLPAAERSGARPHLTALSRHHRIDLVWDAPAGGAWEIQRSAHAEGPFERIHAGPCRIGVHADFLGRPGQTFRYRLRRGGPSPGAWSNTAEAASRQSTREQLLTEVQEASFRYFWDYGHPVSGLAREGWHRDPALCAIGATGMGLFNLVVGGERGFATRRQCAARALKMLRFLAGPAGRYHGAWPHWIHGATGKTVPFSRYDDGADLVETAFLAEGLLCLREYFTGSDEVEAEVRRLADTLWRGIEWDFFERDRDGRTALTWHWSPRHEWKKDLPVVGFNECHIVYVLALASPSHGVGAKGYWDSWQHPRFGTRRTELGVALELHRGKGPPMFWYHYSYLGLDPHAVHYQGRSYFEHFRDLCRVQVLYARSKKEQFAGYGPLWGLTASMGPDGYSARAPDRRDDGTIAPTAAISSMPYLPDDSYACLKEMYEVHGRRVWGACGFTDAFNLSRDWVAPGVLGIDTGPIAPMIENHRTGLCWKTFMKAPEVAAALKRIRQPPPPANAP